VRSWDLFRTLVDSRKGNAGEDAIEDHYPIVENVLQVRPDDLIVSEYELYRADKAKTILALTGLSNALTVTEHGKSDHTVWVSLPGLTEHRGDNQHCDVDSPNSQNIKGIQVTQHRYTKEETEIREAGFPRLAEVMKEARLTTWHHNPELRELQLVQFQVNFPVLYFGSLMLMHQNIQNKILMSSRDCYLWRKLLMKLGVETEYFLTSRVARKRGQKPDGTVVDLVGSGASGSWLPAKVVYLVKWGSNSYVNVSALHEGQAPEMELANPAPHDMAIDSNTTQRFVIDWPQDQMTRTSVEAFEHALNCFQSAEISSIPRNVFANFLNKYQSYPALHLNREAMQEEERSVKRLLEEYK
jgi:hypothetical protein